MIFSDGRLITAIRDGRKTVTRRRMTPGLDCRYRPGRTYAVQRKYRGREVARILIARVEPGTLDAMTEDDARLEGCRSLEEFRATWKQLYPSTRTWSVPVWVISFLCVSRRAPAPNVRRSG